MEKANRIGSLFYGEFSEEIFSKRSRSALRFSFSRSTISISSRVLVCRGYVCANPAISIISESGISSNYGSIPRIESPKFIIYQNVGASSCAVVPMYCGFLKSCERFMRRPSRPWQGAQLRKNNFRPRAVSAPRIIPFESNKL